MSVVELVGQQENALAFVRGRFPYVDSEEVVNAALVITVERRPANPVAYFWRVVKSEGAKQTAVWQDEQIAVLGPASEAAAQRAEFRANEVERVRAWKLRNREKTLAQHSRRRRRNGRQRTVGSLSRAS